MSLGVRLVCKTEPWISSYWNFTQNETIRLILKNTIFNRSSFAEYKAVIGFVASKWVWEWSQILILSPGWPSIQNKAKFLTVNFTNYLEKRDFLQTILNIGILYTVGNNFSPRVWIWDRYLKIRLRLAKIIWQSLSLLHRNVCRRSGHFRREWRIPLWRRGQEELVETKNCCPTR